MQIATLSYPYNAKENFHSDSRTKLQHRLVLATRTNPEKKQNQRRSFVSNAPLPPLKSSKRLSSILIKGDGLKSSNFHERSTASFRQPSRSHSRQSDQSENLRIRSRSITPSGRTKSTQKLIRLKFGYPVKLRSSDFYHSRLSDDELRLREESFVNDSIRSSHQSSCSSFITRYDPLNDPSLSTFFQSPSVLDVIRKTLNVELDKKPSQLRKKSKPQILNDDYRRIVAKRSSGYGKLNGYDCIPKYAPGRHKLPIKQDRFQHSANSSLASFPTHSSDPIPTKEKYNHNNKRNRLIPLATSSPLRHPRDRTTDIATASSLSQD